jgi:hypothetical protein
MSNSKGRNIGGDMLPVAGPLPFNLIFSCWSMAGCWWRAA